MRSLAINVNRRCPLACKHCSLGFTEDYHGDHRFDVSPEKMKRLVEDVDPGVYQLLVMAGGEPSLSPKTVKAGVEACREIGLMSSMVSAPVWGKTVKTAQRFLDRIDGLNMVILSYDDYHLEFLTKDHYRNAAQAASSRGILVSLQVCYSRPEEKERLRQDLADLSPSILKILYTPASALDEARHEELRSSWVEVGNASDLEQIQRTCGAGNCFLDDELGVHGCCWSCAAAESPIHHTSQGDSDSIREAFRELEDNALFRSLCTRGFLGSLSQEGRRKLAESVRGERFATECEICVRVMTPGDKDIWSCFSSLQDPPGKETDRPAREAP